MLTFQAMLPFDIGPFTYAEAAQMFVEHQRDRWQHTSFIVAYLIQVNRTDKGKPIQPEDLNPWEAKPKQGTPLSTREGFNELKKVADQWPGRSKE